MTVWHLNAQGIYISVYWKLQNWKTLWFRTFCSKFWGLQTWKM